MTDVRLTAVNPADSSIVPVACNASGEILVGGPGGQDVFPGDVTIQGTLSASGGFTSSAVSTFQGNVTFTSPVVMQDYLKNTHNPEGQCYIAAENGGVNYGLLIADGETVKAGIKMDGSPTFSSEKCGFTSDGRLWLTDTNGGVVVTSSVVNGVMQWTAYTRLADVP